MFRPNQQQFRVNEQELNALLQEAFNQGAQRGKTAAAFGLGQNGQAAPKTSSIASHIFQTLYNDPFKLLQAGLVLGTASHLNKMQQATGNLSAALVNTAKATELLSQSAANLATSVQTATTIVNDAVSIISNHHFEYVLAGAAFIAAATHFESRYHPLKNLYNATLKTADAMLKKQLPQPISEEKPTTEVAATPQESGANQPAPTLRVNPNSRRAPLNLDSETAALLRMMTQQQPQTGNS